MDSSFSNVQRVPFFFTNVDKGTSGYHSYDPRNAMYSQFATSGRPNTLSLANKPSNYPIQTQFTIGNSPGSTERRHSSTGTNRNALTGYMLGDPMLIDHSVPQRSNFVGQSYNSTRFNSPQLEDLLRSPARPDTGVAGSPYSYPAFGEASLGSSCNSPFGNAYASPVISSQKSHEFSSNFITSPLFHFEPSVQGSLSGSDLPSPRSLSLGAMYESMQHSRTVGSSPQQHYVTHSNIERSRTSSTSLAATPGNVLFSNSNRDVNLFRTPTNNMSLFSAKPPFDSIRGGFSSPSMRSVEILRHENAKQPANNFNVQSVRSPDNFSLENIRPSTNFNVESMLSPRGFATENKASFANVKTGRGSNSFSIEKITSPNIFTGHNLKSPDNFTEPDKLSGHKRGSFNSHETESPSLFDLLTREQRIDHGNSTKLRVIPQTKIPQPAIQSNQWIINNRPATKDVPAPRPVVTSETWNLSLQAAKFSSQTGALFEQERNSAKTVQYTEKYSPKEVSVITNNHKGHNSSVSVFTSGKTSNRRSSDSSVEHTPQNSNVIDYTALERPVTGTSLDSVNHSSGSIIPSLNDSSKSFISNNTKASGAMPMQLFQNAESSQAKILEFYRTEHIRSADDKSRDVCHLKSPPYSDNSVSSNIPPPYPDKTPIPIRPPPYSDEQVSLVRQETNSVRPHEETSSAGPPHSSKETSLIRPPPYSAIDLSSARRPFGAKETSFIRPPPYTDKGTMSVRQPTFGKDTISKKPPPYPGKDTSSARTPNSGKDTNLITPTLYPNKDTTSERTPLFGKGVISIRPSPHSDNETDSVKPLYSSAQTSSEGPDNNKSMRTSTIRTTHSSNDTSSVRSPAYLDKDLNSTSSPSLSNMRTGFPSSILSSSEETSCSSPQSFLINPSLIDSSNVVSVDENLDGEIIETSNPASPSQRKIDVDNPNLVRSPVNLFEKLFNITPTYEEKQSFFTSHSNKDHSTMKSKETPSNIDQNDVIVIVEDSDPTPLPKPAKEPIKRVNGMDFDLIDITNETTALSNRKNLKRTASEIDKGETLAFENEDGQNEEIKAVFENDTFKNVEKHKPKRRKYSDVEILKLDIENSYFGKKKESLSSSRTSSPTDSLKSPSSSDLGEAVEPLLQRNPSEMTREERAIYYAMLKFQEMEKKEMRKVKAKNAKNKKENSKVALNSKDQNEDASKVSKDQFYAGNEKEEKGLKDAFIENEGKDKNSSEKKNVSMSQKGLKLKEIKVKVLKEHIVISDNDTSEQDTKETEVTASQPNKARKRSTRKDSEPEVKRCEPLSPTKLKLVINQPKVSLSRSNETLGSRDNVTNRKSEKPDRVETCEPAKPPKKVHLEKKQSIQNERKTHSIEQKYTESEGRENDQRTAADALRHRQDLRKSYLLVPSYKGFKDFTPVLLESRTRRRKATDEPEKSEKDGRPNFPILVVEKFGEKKKEILVQQGESLEEKLAKESLLSEGGENEPSLGKVKSLSCNHSTGETVLHKAARLGYADIAEAKIKQGCDINAKDHAGWTALHEACARGKIDVVRVLLKYGADPNSCSNTGIRPIHDALEGNFIDIVRMLLSYGADPKLDSYSGLSTEDFAKSNEVKEFLKDHCIDSNFHDDPIEHDGFHKGRWKFRGSCFALDKEADVAEIFSEVPFGIENPEIEFEAAREPHLPVYNLPILKEGKILGYKNYFLLNDILHRLNTTRANFLRKHKTELREMSWSEFTGHISKSQVTPVPVDLPSSSSESEPMVELVSLGHYAARRTFDWKVIQV